MNWKGRVVTVAGAASGTGLSLAHLLYERGASLSLADFNPETPAKAAEAMASKEGQKVTTRLVDVTKATEVDNWINETVRNHGAIHHSANVAGISDPIKKISEKTDADFDLPISVNVRGNFNCLRAQTRVMKAARASSLYLLA